jgi:tRNA(Ile)-lysidine synthase TilS/MesJ
MKNIFSRISFIVHEKQEFNSANSILTAISGGQDSIVLLLVLIHLNSLYNFSLHILYCNHFWQKKNFYTLIQVFKISYLLNKNIHFTVPKNLVSSELSAHLWRKKNFYKIANFLKLNTLILAHSATDQLETSFWHLCRGTSPTGVLSLKENSQLNFQNNENDLVLMPIKMSIIKKNKKRISSSLIFWPLKLKKITIKKSLNFNNTIFYDTKDVINLAPGKIHKKKILPHINLILFKNNILKKLPLKKQLQSNSSVYLYNQNKIITYYNFNKQISLQIQIKRPLINFYRSMIKNLIVNYNLPMITDETNFSLNIMRNKIRLLIFPLVRNYIHKFIDFHFKNYIDIITSEQNYLIQLNQKITQFYCNHPELVKSILLLPIAIQMSVIKTISEQYTNKQIKKAQLEEILISANQFNKK